MTTCATSRKQSVDASPNSTGCSQEKVDKSTHSSFISVLQTLSPSPSMANGPRPPIDVSTTLRAPTGPPGTQEQWIKVVDSHVGANFLLREPKSIKPPYRRADAKRCGQRGLPDISSRTALLAFDLGCSYREPICWITDDMSLTAH